MEISVLEKINTSTDRELLLAEIDLLVGSLYQNDANAFDSFLQTQVREWVSHVLLEGIARSGMSRQEYFKKLRKEVVEMKQVFLVLAFEPSSSCLALLAKYVKSECGVHTVLTIQYDPEIIAGAKIISKNRFRDYSLQRKFDDTLQQFIKNQPTL